LFFEEQKFLHGSRTGEQGFSWARQALIAVALLAVYPTDFSALWGARLLGKWWEPLAVCALWALLSWWWAPRGFSSHSLKGERRAGLLLSADVVCISLLLALSGAAQNPFTLLFFVPITLATVVAPRWTWRVAVLAVACFALLLFQTAVTLKGHRNHEHMAHFFQHVQGMAIALAVAGAFVTFFVNRIARALEAQRVSIAELSRARQEDHFAIALGALSAGAAHELGSPLGTIQILSEELAHIDESEREASVRTIVSEVQRMKKIVHSMDSSELSAALLGDGCFWKIASLQEEFQALGVLFQCNESIEISQPRNIVAQMLRELVRNAQRVATKDGVQVETLLREDQIYLRVIDDGPGLSAEQLKRVKEPFFSETGGTGLGLFLAMVHARQLGGSLEITSQLGQGSQVEICLPRLGFSGKKSDSLEPLHAVQEGT